MMTEGRRGWNSRAEGPEKMEVDGGEDSLCQEQPEEEEKKCV